MNIDSKPTLDSFVFIIEDKDGVNYDAFLDLNGELTSEGGSTFIDLRYRKVGDTSGKWSYLTSFDILIVKTPQETDARMDQAIVFFNEEIAKKFGTQASPIPTKYIDRIFWTLKNGLKAVNNVISRI